MSYNIQQRVVDPQYSGEGVRALQTMLNAQLEDMKLLCTIVEYLRGYQAVGLDRAEAKKYTDKIQLMTDRQQGRFSKIDMLINENIKDMKKRKTEDESVFRLGREVRKTEAGLRTLKLFACDMIDMVRVDSTKLNRFDERLRYFEGRSASLEAEIQLLFYKVHA